MSSIVIVVFKATVGLLVNKGRDKAAEKLKDGDVTDQKFRALIVREIDDMKSKLDGLARKDLGASISFFKEGIGLLYEVFGEARSRSECKADTVQAARAEALSLTEGMRNLELTDLDESASRMLVDAKERFKDARRKATEAFANTALEISDRMLAMQYRVMATILEKVDNPADAVAPCKVCIEELHSLSVVQNSFEVQLKKGIQAFKGLFGKEERREIICSVYHVNRVIHDVMLAVGNVVSASIFPVIDIGKEKVDLLFDHRVTKVLRKQGMEHCCVTWSFGQEGKVEHKLKDPTGIATNSSGQFIVADPGDGHVKVFDSSGKLVKHFSLPAVATTVLDVATDKRDNIFVLAALVKDRLGFSHCVLLGSRWVYKFTEAADLHHKFVLREGDWVRLSVSDRDKVLVLDAAGRQVHEYETDGQFVRRFGEGINKFPSDVTAANDGRVMVARRDGSCVDIFSEHGDLLDTFKLQISHSWPRIAFHRASEHVVVAGVDEDEEFLHVEVYNKDGKFVRSTQIHEENIRDTRGITVTAEGRIAVVTLYFNDERKVLVL